MTRVCFVCGERPEEVVDHDGDPMCQQCFEPEALPATTDGPPEEGRQGAAQEEHKDGAGKPIGPERHIVWICAGCDKCQPLDGSDRQSYPCTDTSPSMDGAEVVRSEDYDRMCDEAMGERYIQGIYRAALEQVRHCAACPGGLSVLEMQREIVSIVDSVIGPHRGPFEREDR